MATNTDRIEVLESHIESLTARLDAAEKHTTEMRAYCDGFTAGLALRIDALDAKLAAIESALARPALPMSDVNDALAKFRTEFDAFRRRYFNDRGEVFMLDNGAETVYEAGTFVPSGDDMTFPLANGHDDDGAADADKDT